MGRMFLAGIWLFLISPIGWTYAIYMWGYALVWFVFNDVIKMLTYLFIVLLQQGENFTVPYISERINACSPVALPFTSWLQGAFLDTST